jgi:hypothetical protein
MGYVTHIVPFAYAITILITKEAREEHIRNIATILKNRICSTYYRNLIGFLVGLQRIRLGWLLVF